MDKFEAHCQVIERDTLEVYGSDEGAVWFRATERRARGTQVNEIELSREDAKALRRYLKRALAR